MTILFQIAAQYAMQYEFDKNLIFAIIHVESSGNNYAIRYEPQWKYTFSVKEFAKKNRISQDTEKFLQSCSLGVMQVMGTVARELGFKDELTRLFSPHLSIEYGVKKLEQIRKRFPKYTEEDLIAAYNAGTARRKRDGEYFNQDYVTKVTRILRKLRDGADPDSKLN